MQCISAEHEAILKKDIFKKTCFCTLRPPRLSWPWQWHCAWQLGSVRTLRVQLDGKPGQSAANLTHNFCHLMPWKTDNCKPCCTWNEFHQKGANVSRISGKFKHVVKANDSYVIPGTVWFSRLLHHNKEGYLYGKRGGRRLRSLIVHPQTSGIVDKALACEKGPQLLTLKDLKDVFPRRKSPIS